MTSEKQTGIPRRGGDENDAFSKFGKKFLKWQAGVRATIKKRYNKRVRKTQVSLED